MPSLDPGKLASANLVENRNTAVTVEDSSGTFVKNVSLKQLCKGNCTEQLGNTFKFIVKFTTIEKQLRRESRLCLAPGNTSALN